MKNGTAIASMIIKLKGGHRTKCFLFVAWPYNIIKYTSPSVDNKYLQN